jgi:hypothetical protein
MANFLPDLPFISHHTMDAIKPVIIKVKNDVGAPPPPKKKKKKKKNNKK